MEHPNIARVFDGGATESGRPYFVMELVRGLPITRYCDERRLGTVERLELFVQVCQAVQHAHENFDKSIRTPVKNRASPLSDLRTRL
jgi:eukaryotic-like serine/threonine-protein kinase